MGLDIRLLRELVANRGMPGRILSLFRDAGLDAGRLGEINPSADAVTPYSRIVLASEPTCEVMVARWTPGRPCAPHNHGTSAGWVYYLAGDFVEQSFRWQAGSLQPGQTHRHPAGTHTQVLKDEIHSCSSAERGLSLHVYFPRIERMRVYDLAGRRTIVVSDDCGAWIPDAPRQRVEEIPWQ